MDARQLQQNLKAAGYDPGPVDGDFGPKTVAALLDYTAARKLGELGQRLARAMVADFRKFSIDTPLRVINHVSQAALETGGFQFMTELGGPTYFSKYDGRADLGNTKPGDGAKYCGRGIFQVTGRGNYRDLGKRIGIDLEAHPERAAEPEIAVTLACLYWSERGLNDYADLNDASAISRAINRGNAKATKPANHEAERLAYVAKLSKLWGVKC